MHWKRAGWALVACLIFLGVLAGPGEALAFPLPIGRVTFASSTSVRTGAVVPPGFKLGSSNGYTIRFLGPLEANGSSRAVALIWVTDRDSAVSYFAPASAAEGSMEVDLGELGHISVAFHATGGTKTEGSQCGERQTFHVEKGYYEGMIEFHGEEGYTEVEASRAEGEAHVLFSLICAAITNESGSGPGLPGAELRVQGPRKSSLPSLTVVENDPRAPVQLEVDLGERRGEITIAREIRMKAPRTAFDYDPRLRTALLEPSAPFSGQARFQRLGRRKGRWRGDLTVDLPGRSGVRLTGGGLRASIFHARFKGSGPIG